MLQRDIYTPRCGLDDTGKVSREPFEDCVQLPC